MNLRTPGATKVVGSLSLLVVAALGWTLAVGPETAALSDARLEIQTTSDRNDVLRQQLASLRRQRLQLASIRESAQRLAVTFPPTADQPGLFRAVTAAAVEAGIGADGVNTLAPTPPMVGGADPATGAVSAAPPAAGTANLARQTVIVAVTGGYTQTERLLENLEHMDRAYLVTGVTLGGGAETGTYTTTITGDMFVMPPVEDPGETLNLSSPRR